MIKFDPARPAGGGGPKEAEHAAPMEPIDALRSVSRHEPDSLLWTPPNAPDTVYPAPADGAYHSAPEKLDFAILQRNLDQCLQIVDSEVMKGYVTLLRDLPILNADEAFLKKLDPVRFFRITKLVYQEKEFTGYKLATVFHALSNKPCTLILLIHSDGQNNEFYLGVRSRDPERFSSGTMKAALEHSLQGQFPGSDTAECTLEEMERLMRTVRSDCVSSVTAVADYKQGREAISNEEFVQGLEKVVLSMQGTAYTAVLIADNLSPADLNGIRREYERIYTQLSPFARMQYAFSLNQSQSTSQSDTAGQTRGTSRGTSVSVGENTSRTDARSSGVTHSQSVTDTTGRSISRGTGRSHTTGTTEGTSDSVSDTHSEGESTMVSANAGFSFAPYGMGPSFGVGVSHGRFSSDAHSVSHAVSHSDSVSDSISRNLNYGLNASRAAGKSVGTNEGTSVSVSRGGSVQIGENSAQNESSSVSTTTTLTSVFGDSRSATLHVENKALLDTLQRLEKQLLRVDQCESLGMWRSAAYFLGESAAEAETAANLYHSLISGEQSGLQYSAVNTWTEAPRAKAVSRFVQNFLHPLFLYERFDGGATTPVAVDPAALSSTAELAIQMGLPRRSIKGLPVVHHALFGREVLKQSAQSSGQAPEDGIPAREYCRLGCVDYLGKETTTAVHLDTQSLSMHTFVTGSTGAGKSNAIYQMLNELDRGGIRFLIVEPAKGEYKNVYGSRRDVSVYGTNPDLTPLLRLNPFSFPDGVHIYEHLDRLIEIFNVCWPMYAAMPVILKDAVEHAYVEAGWDLKRSRNRWHRNLYPDFSDVLRQIETVMDQSQYSDENKSNYKGALCTRLRSLTNGMNGLIFTSHELQAEELFDRNVVVDLSRIGSYETKALIMGLLVIKLQEYRMASAGAMNAKLRHVTVLEEAHHLLKRGGQGDEGANLQEKSVEMLTNAVAEMRTYGEGFIIADQSPGLLDAAVIRNTNTKIILRLPEYTDRELAGRAAALNDDQIAELSRLSRGVAAVYQNDWLEAVLCKVDRVDANGTFSPAPDTEEEDAERLKERILSLLLHNELLERFDEIRTELALSSAPLSLKRAVFDYHSAEADARAEKLPRLVLALFSVDALSAGEWLKQAKIPSSYDSFRQTALTRLHPDLRSPVYSHHLDQILYLLLYEAAKRRAEYVPLWTECPIRKGKGDAL